MTNSELLKEQWKTFYRVWRVLRKYGDDDPRKGLSIDEAAREVFQGLFRYWFNEMNYSADQVDKYATPRFLRNIFYKHNGSVYVSGPRKPLKRMKGRARK